MVKRRTHKGNNTKRESKHNFFIAYIFLRHNAAVYKLKIPPYSCGTPIFTRFYFKACALIPTESFENKIGNWK